MFLYVCVLAFFNYFYFDTSMGSFLRRRGFYFRFLFALKMAALLKSLFHLQFDLSSGEVGHLKQTTISRAR